MRANWKVPRINCKETALLIAHFAFLIGRTWLSVVVARLDGAIVRDLVAANGKGFAKGLIYWFLIAIPASYNNAMVFIDGNCLTKDSLSSIETLNCLPNTAYPLCSRLVSQFQATLLQNPKPRWRHHRDRSIYYHRHRSILWYCCGPLFYPWKANYWHVRLQLSTLPISWAPCYTSHPR